MIHAQGLIGGGGVDGVASHPASLILLCIGDIHHYYSATPLHQYSLLWVVSPSATFHAKFLDQHLLHNGQIAIYSLHT
jgi:hypothetical protein